MDVPIAACRLADQGKIKDALTDRQDLEADFEERGISADRDVPDADVPAMAAISEPAHEEVHVDGLAQDAATDAHKLNPDEEWNAPYEAAVAGSVPGMAPPAVPPLPEEVRSPSRRSWNRRISPYRRQRKLRLLLLTRTISILRRPPAQQMVHEPRLESHGEDQCSMAVRPTDAVTDLAWVAIVKSSSRTGASDISAGLLTPGWSLAAPSMLPTS